MNDPVSDLVMLKKICVELQREIAYSQPDRGAVERLARDVEHLAQRMIEWAKE
ncbi:MAG: hypothetical protein ACO22N_09640 [Ilumatobacteraceae bacterium]|jgi:hypothetical protein